MERCPRCERVRVEYDPYQQRRVCTNPECSWRERPEEARRALADLRRGDARRVSYVSDS